MLFRSVRRAIWEKFVFLVGLSGTTATMGVTIGPIRSNAQTRAFLLESGSFVAQGAPDEIIRRERVIESFFGQEIDGARTGPPAVADAVPTDEVAAR